MVLPYGEVQAGIQLVWIIRCINSMDRLMAIIEKSPDYKLTGDQLPPSDFLAAPEPVRH